MPWEIGIKHCFAASVDIRNGPNTGTQRAFFIQEENDETIISVAQKEQLKQDLFFKKWRMAWDGKPFLKIGQERSGFNMSEKLNI